ncbi:hypothetical protein R3P38DRAFT_2433018, partial [Favolaschia claudopus]
SDVPDELWSLIGSFASRQTVARLCSVSQYFYVLFSPSLYSNTVDPPLTASQSTLLLRTLVIGTYSELESTSITKPSHNHLHPASLIKQLGLVDRYGHEYLRDKHEIFEIFRALEQPALAEGLRTLHWSLVAGIDELGRIMGVAGKFPHLKELSVSSRGNLNNFNFVHIPCLEVLRIELDLTSVLEHGKFAMRYYLCFKFAEAIQMLPCSSPLLHALHLDIKIPFWEGFGFPEDGYPDLIAALNSIRLPMLLVFDISVDLVPEDFWDYGTSLDYLPQTDLAPFLRSHPSLVHLTLNVLGTKLDEQVTFLPKLRSFSGSFAEASLLCARQRHLQKLTIKLVYKERFTPLPLPQFAIAELGGWSLTHLRISAYDVFGQYMKYTDEISPTTFHDLASSLPNLVDLDITISHPMRKYRDHLTSLTELQSLRIHQYRIRYLGPPNWPAHLVFPSDEYVEEFAFVLPSLPQLTRIEISVIGDISPLSKRDCNHNHESTTSPDCDSDCDVVFPDICWESLGDTPDVTVSYSFSVSRPSSGACLVLNSA